MTHDVNWSPYAGSSSFILAGVLLLATVVLMYVGVRFRQGKPGIRPGKFLGALLISSFVLAILTFLTAVGAYGLADVQQGINFTSTDPITPVTLTAAIVTFFVILYLTHKRGARAAIGSAIVGTIAAPLIFELPFDLIVMWQTFPPSPPTLYTPLFFFPLFLVEILSFALLTLSPVMRLSKVTFFLLAGMFFVFAVWALAGFAYPSTPFPIAMNMLSKIVAFAVAISLFWRGREKPVLPARPREVTSSQGEQSSEAALHFSPSKLENHFVQACVQARPRTARGPAQSAPRARSTWDRALDLRYAVNAGRSRSGPRSTQPRS